MLTIEKLVKSTLELQTFTKSEEESDKKSEHHQIEYYNISNSKTKISKQQKS